MKDHIADHSKPFLYVFISKTKYHVSFFIQFSTALFIITLSAV